MYPPRPSLPPPSQLGNKAPCRTGDMIFEFDSSLGLQDAALIRRTPDHDSTESTHLTANLFPRSIALWTTSPLVKTQFDVTPFLGTCSMPVTRASEGGMQHVSGLSSTWVGSLGLASSNRHVYIA
ncbi:hypothetical protein AG1IA_08313 [Rhizoctonia solani AG-1 IA]|uniref:Uncharacterized protein n=1 Tax=Thanatephorus cucumeris (strain AG1-IA) TaxID=983506 RepID=L8WIB1_THACA|nr:hypothetical protein AG1IA_08313 [Rhizoctonia solani AG-1 IA]